MKSIPLTRGLFAFVDDSDYDCLVPFRWRAVKSESGKFYAVTGQHRNDSLCLMHTLLLGEKGIDHKDGNGLNNQMENLRVATQSQNKANVGLNRTNTSGFKGVSFTGYRHNPWRAQIKVNGHVKHVGCFPTPHAAAIAYNEAAKQAFGEFAMLNSV